MASKGKRVSQAAAEEAVRTLLRWAGDDPAREGLTETPRRVVEAYRDWFSGYAVDPRAYLRRTFEEIAGYDEMVVLRDIEFESHCEHHMAPIIGRAHVGYLPTQKIVGISKLARVVDVYARRFQVQEKMTAEIARCVICLRQGAWPRRGEDVEEVDVEKLKEMVHVNDSDLQVPAPASAAQGGKP